MSIEPARQLTIEQKRDVCTIAAVGCERRVAARYLGVEPSVLAAEIRRDAKFANELAQSEARAELTHVRNVQQAAQDDRHWRASVWWLERRAADRYGKQPVEAIPPAKLRRFIDALVKVIAEEVQVEADRERLMARIQTLTLDVVDDASLTSDSTGEGEGGT